jgi:hypothetical protein
MNDPPVEVSPANTALPGGECGRAENRIQKTIMRLRIWTAPLEAVRSAADSAARRISRGSASHAVPRSTLASVATHMLAFLAAMICFLARSVPERPRGRPKPQVRPVR